MVRDTLFDTRVEKATRAALVALPCVPANVPACSAPVAVVWSVERDRGASRLVDDRSRRVLHRPLDAVHPFETRDVRGADEDVRPRIAARVRLQLRDIAREGAGLAPRILEKEVPRDRVRGLRNGAVQDEDL